jgi:hypothetical protein
LAFLAPVELKRSLHHVQYDYAGFFVVHLINIGIAKSIGLQIFTEDASFFISYFLLHGLPPIRAMGNQNLPEMSRWVIADLKSLAMMVAYHRGFSA